MQHDVGAADQDGQIGRAHLKLIEQRLSIGVTIEVDVVERMAVTRQEIFYSQRTGAVGRPNHDDIAKLVCDQLQAAEHERPHENLAQLGVCLNQGEQLFTLELNHFTAAPSTV